jgi:hypothetical protein
MFFEKLRVIVFVFIRVLRQQWKETEKEKKMRKRRWRRAKEERR